MHREERQPKGIDEAINRLIRAKETINFNSVAQEANVSKSMLYNYQEYRERIEMLRDQQSQLPSPKQMKREMNESNKDALIESYKRKIKKLESENKELRQQLKIAYGDVYKQM